MGERDEEQKLRDNVWEQISPNEYTKTVDERERGSRYDQYGICAKCVGLFGIATEFNVIRATCNKAQHLPLSTQNPVTHCTRFEALGELSLYDLFQMAKIMDDPKRRSVGFRQT